jgi:hypothetical protein
MAGESAVSPSVALLFNLLQVLAWAAAGFAVGALRDWLVRWGRGWAASEIRRAALSLGPGVLLIWAGYVAVPSWLQVEGPRWLDPIWLPAQVVLAGVVAWGLDGLLRYLGQPVVATSPSRNSREETTEPGVLQARTEKSARRRSARLRKRSAWRGGSRSGTSVVERRGGDDPLKLLGRARPKAQGQDQEDIIMLEID